MAHSADVAIITFQVPREQAVDLAIEAGRRKLAEMLGVDADVADAFWADGHERQHIIDATIRSGAGQDPERNIRDTAHNTIVSEARRAGWEAVRTLTRSIESSFYGDDRRSYKAERYRIRNLHMYVGDVFERCGDQICEIRDAEPGFKP